MSEVKPTQDDGNALKIWREWFEFGGDPWITGDDTAICFCFFCVGNHPNHEPNCSYVKAGTLLNIPLHDGNY